MRKTSYILTAISDLKKGGVSYMENETDKEKVLLQHFDNVFKTNTIEHYDYYFSKIKMLKNIYEVLEEEICRTNPTYDYLRKQHIDITNLLEQSFSNAQQTLFEKHLDIGSQMVSVESEQMFYFGYIMAKTLEQDIPIIEKENN